MAGRGRGHHAGLLQMLINLHSTHRTDKDKTCCLQARVTSAGCDGCKTFKSEHSSRRIASQPSTLQSTLLIYSLHSRP